MKTCKTALPASLILLLCACGGSEPEPDASDEAADFAARINSTSAPAPAPAGMAAPTVEPPHEDAAQGPFVAGTATDPQSSTCGANAMGDFLGKKADEAIRRAVMEAAGDGREVRFIAYGSDNIPPDPTNPRLNLMLDRTGIIKDARCG